MPNRIVREGILTSEAVNCLNWAEEVFYRRLLSVVDDFGRYYAAPKLLRAACYPLHIDKVSDSDIGKWLSACETAALVRVYPAQDGKRYLEVARFNQQVRSKASRFPQPLSVDVSMRSTCVADAQHMQADAHLGVFVSEDVSEGERDARKRATPAKIERPEDINEQVWLDWVALRKAKKTTVSETAIEGARAEAKKAGLTITEFLRLWVTRGSQGFQADWIKPAELASLRAVPTPLDRGPDPELERLKREAAQATPMPSFVKELAAQLTGKAH